MAGRLAPHLRGEPVGLPAVWRPHTCGRYHRGPRRHPEDSHAPRAPDRGVSAPAAAVRPVRLELKSAGGVALPRLPPRVCPPGDVWRLPPPRRVPDGGPGPSGGPPAAT